MRPLPARSARIGATLIAVVTAGLAAVPGAEAAVPRPTASACPPAVVPIGSFDDTRGSTHEPAVDCLVWRDVARGVGYGTYAPAAPVRRDQMASLVARTLDAAGAELPPPGSMPFTDVDPGVHADAIARLAAAGIVGGVTATRFDPAAAIRREQMAALLVRAAGKVAGAPLPAGPDAFGDDDASVHEAAIDAAAAAGLTLGVAPGRYDPTGAVRRDHMATFLARLLALLTDGGHAPAPAAVAAFDGEVAALPAPVAESMVDVSWRPGCPVGLGDLVLLRLTHRGLDGNVHRGELVVAAGVADPVLSAMHALFDDGFAIARMRRVDAYGGNDDRSMADNNTSAFNCRAVAGGSGWSEHAYGTAIDINPVHNPYVRGDTVLPPAGRDHLDRGDIRPGMIVRPGAVVEAFEAIGWRWGGDWHGLKDYQHLSRSGR